MMENEESKLKVNLEERIKAAMDRYYRAVARDEREHLRPNKKKNAWSKVKCGGKRIALRKPYHDEYLKDLRGATI